MKTKIKVYIGKTVNGYKIPFIKIACKESIQHLCKVCKELDIQVSFVLDNDNFIQGVLLSDKDKNETSYPEEIEMRA